MKQVAVFRYSKNGWRLVFNSAIAAVVGLAWGLDDTPVGIFFFLVAVALLLVAVRVRVRIDGNFLQVRNLWGLGVFDLTSQDVHVWVPGPPPYSSGSGRQGLHVRTSVDDWVFASATWAWHSKRSERKLAELTRLLRHHCEGGAKLVVGGDPPTRWSSWFDG